MEKGSRTSLIAVIGVVVSVLTLYYARRDKAAEEREKAAKAAEQRPVIDIMDGRAVSRQITPFVGHVIEFDVGSLMFVNHGTREAGNVEVELTNGGTSQLGEIAPGQTRPQQFTITYDAAKNRYRYPQFRGIVRYTDRMEGSRKFEEKFCFQAPHTIGAEGFLKPAVNDLQQKYDPPDQMGRCSPGDKSKPLN